MTESFNQPKNIALAVGAAMGQPYLGQKNVDSTGGQQRREH